jgi:hypothetical protein
MLKMGWYEYCQISVVVQSQNDMMLQLSSFKLKVPFGQQYRMSSLMHLENAVDELIDNYSLLCLFI